MRLQIFNILNLDLTFAMNPVRFMIRSELNGILEALSFDIQMIRILS